MYQIACADPTSLNGSYGHPRLWEADGVCQSGEYCFNVGPTVRDVQTAWCTGTFSLHRIRSPQGPDPTEILINPPGGPTINMGIEVVLIEGNNTLSPAESIFLGAQGLGLGSYHGFYWTKSSRAMLARIPDRTTQLLALISLGDHHAGQDVRMAAAFFDSG